MTYAYNLKPLFDDLQRQLEIKDGTLDSYFYDCKDWRIDDDGEEVFYTLNGKNCSIKVYPSISPLFEHKAVIKVGNRERAIQTSKNLLPIYLQSNGRKCKKRGGLLERLVSFSVTDF